MERLASEDLEVRQLTSPSIFKGKFRLTNNLISDILFLHTASMKSRCFLFIFVILVFMLDSRLVRKLVNVNVYLKKIPCFNKNTLPYLTLPPEKTAREECSRLRRLKPEKTTGVSRNLLTLFFLGSYFQGSGDQASYLLAASSERMERQQW